MGRDETDPSSFTDNKTAQLSENPKKGVLKNFTPEEFKNLYNGVAYPNSEFISDDTPITGNRVADSRIRSLAEARGYQKRSAPVSNNFISVAKDMVLQEKSARLWLAMKATAKEGGQDLELTAAYRSADEQKKILLTKLKNIPAKDIANGRADRQVDEILAFTAPPGYSRHHTGYTVDIACENDPNVLFEKSSCYKWLSGNNFKNAKKYGWIPSYPEGTGAQGPEPEAWEYVWVGLDILTE